MRMGRALVAWGIVLTVLPGCAGPPSARVVTNEQLQSAGYYKYWDARLPLSESDGVKDCFLVDDNLYITTTSGRFYCVSAEQGLLRWTTRLTQPNFEIFRPSHIRTANDDGPLVVVTTTQTFILDRYSGDLITAFTPPFGPGAGAVGREGRLYFAGADGRMHALQWKHPFGKEPFRRWQLLAGGAVTTTPVLIGEDQLIFASHSGIVVSCGAYDKTYGWVKKTEAAVVADPFVDETGVYVAGTDRSLYRFDLGSGGQQWRFRFPKPLVDSPAVARHICYQYCPTTGLTAIDVETGDKKWVRADGKSFVAGGFGESVIFTEGGTVDVVDSLTGQTKRSFDAGGAARIVCNTRDDRIILVTEAGQINCVRPESIPYLKRQQVRAARRTLTQKPRSELDEGDWQPPAPRAPASSSVDVFRSERD